LSGVFGIETIDDINSEYINTFSLTVKSRGLEICEICGYPTAIWSGNSNYDHDRQLLEIKRGNKTLNYEWINNSVFVVNSSSSIPQNSPILSLSDRSSSNKKSGANNLTPLLYNNLIKSRVKNSDSGLKKENKIAASITISDFSSSSPAILNNPAGISTFRLILISFHLI
jgi:hypothetical protein